MSTAEFEPDRSIDEDPSIPDANLRLIYDEVDAAVSSAGPICELSGRCCRFREYGHTLFLSGPEFGYLVRHAPSPVRPVDSGETCPWQDQSGRCCAREARPLGCRVYFCDPTYQDLAPVLSEQFISQLKKHAERHNLAWNYAPLHHHLESVAFERCL
jgi:hypothetical protein